MHLATLFTLPLLASAVAAVPTAPWSAGQQAPVGAPDADIKIDLDLQDLRLVQFSDDEAPTWV